MWQQYEAIHDLAYFSPAVLDAASELGLRGFWMGYFAFRAAPLGAVDPAVVTAVFYGFSERRVRRALPDAWGYTSPERAIAARQDGLDRALWAVLGDTVNSSEVAEAAELLWRAAQAADTAGRPLAAANKVLARPGQPQVALWQATAVLREHRGDGHNAVLVSRGMPPAQAHLLKVAAGESDEEQLRQGRGFDGLEWEQARLALVERGLLGQGGELTELGQAEHRAIEDATDAASVQPWQELGEVDTTRLLQLLRPLASAVMSSGVVPQRTAVGMVWTE